MDDEADRWFYNLEALAAQVQRNRRSAHRANQRALALALFTLFAFLLLAWRTETQAHQIRVAEREAVHASYNSCVAGVRIIERFNASQRALMIIERDQHTLPAIADRRIAAYMQAIVEPLPNCGSPPPR